MRRTCPLLFESDWLQLANVRLRKKEKNPKVVMLNKTEWKLTLGPGGPCFPGGHMQGAGVEPTSLGPFMHYQEWNQPSMHMPKAFNKCTVTS